MLDKINKQKTLNEEEEKKLTLSKCTLEERIKILSKLKNGTSSEKQSAIVPAKNKTLADLIKPISESGNFSNNS